MNGWEGCASEPNRQNVSFPPRLDVERANTARFRRQRKTRDRSWGLFEHNPSRGGADPTSDADEKTETEREEPILCRQCEGKLSEHSALFLMGAERVSRVFANPHGFLHEIVTVRWAQNLVTVGPATTEFTWYPGYAWQIAHCGQCHSHIGWSFDNGEDDREPRSFWGLRRQQISGA